MSGGARRHSEARAPAATVPAGRSVGTARAARGLRALASAAVDLVGDAKADARKAFREEMRRRAALAFDALGLSTADLGTALAMDTKRVARYRDPGPDGLAAPWWALATLPPAAFQGAVAALQELHRDLHGDPAELSLEQRCHLALEAAGTLGAGSHRALADDHRISPEEARALLPDALLTLRRVQAFYVALGGDPGDMGDPE